MTSRVAVVGAALVTFMTVAAAWSSRAEAQDCGGCNAFPTLCGKIDVCVKSCNVAAVQAQNCYQAKKVSLDQCKAVYPSCKGDDPACAACRSYPSECKTIDVCIAKCNVAPVQAKNCFE